LNTKGIKEKQLFDSLEELTEAGRIFFDEDEEDEDEEEQK